MNTNLFIMEASVSDYALLCLRNNEPRALTRTLFKFQNGVTSIYGFHDSIKDNWKPI